MNVTFWQVVVTGVLSLLGAVVAGLFAYRQATRVAERQGETSVAVKKLENDGAVHGYLHDDILAARLELKEERTKHLECIEAKAHAESEVRRLEKEGLRLVSSQAQIEANNGVLKGIIEQLEKRNDELEAARRAWELWLDRPDVLRNLADAAEYPAQTPNHRSHGYTSNPHNSALPSPPFGTGGVHPLPPIPPIGQPHLDASAPARPEATSTSNDA